MSPVRKNLLAVCAASLMALSLMACGSQNEPDTSSIKVTNGRSAVANEYPSVVLLIMFAPQGQSICTGTFISDSQLLTAGHCAEGLDPANPAMIYAREVDGKITPIAKALSYKRHPLYDIRNGVSPLDVSVITFPPQTAPAISAIAPASPARGDTLTIVGYGNNENFVNTSGEQGGSGAGVKRVGSNKVAAVDQGFISFYGVPGALGELNAGDLVSSGSGDSGGPLFVSGKLAGVTSGGGLRVTNGGLISASLYVDLNSPQMKTFLSTALINP